MSEEYYTFRFVRLTTKAPFFALGIVLVCSVAWAQDPPAPRVVDRWGQAWPVAPGNPLLTGRIAGFERGAAIVLAVQEAHPCAVRFAASSPRLAVEFDGTYLSRVGDDRAIYTRDARGRISEARYEFVNGSGFVTTFTYNRQNQLAVATTALGESGSLTQRFRWQDGRVAAVVEVDGTQSPRVMTELVFGYERHGWPNRMRVRQSREVTIDLHFEEGRLLRETERTDNREITYQYDSEHRLSRAGDAEFFYGNACTGGNR